MPKDHAAYRSKMPNPDGSYSYTAAEDALWSRLMTRQMEALRGRAAPEFLAGIAALGLSPRHVPQVADIDARLGALTGAGAEGVPAIIPPTRFFTLLAARRFPVATFLRRPEEIDYIEEPDIFHEVFGHCPMLTQPDFARFIEAFGKAALDMPKDMRWAMFRLFWFTVEFGLVGAPDSPRAYGAGIASSPSETAHAFGGGAEILPFDLTTVLRTPYRIDIVQPVYFLIPGFSTLAALAETDLPAAIRAAQALGDLPPRFDPAPKA